MDELRDFLSFVGTYVTTFQPYTAFFRVVPIEMIPAIAQRGSLSKNIIGVAARLVAGGTIAEAVLTAGGRAARKSIPLSSAMGTMSACLGQAVIQGYDAAAIDWITSEWHNVHRLKRDAADRATLESYIAVIWELVADALVGMRFGPNASLSNPMAWTISRFISDAVHNQKIDKDLLRSLANNLSAPVDLAKVLSSPREERIRIFNEFVAGPELASDDPVSSQFMAGLLLALSGNGSFEFLRSGRQLMERSPASIIWFGICAALFEESNVLTTFNCIGRRIVRDLQSIPDLFDAPRADLNSLEYRILRRDPVALDQVNSRAAGGFDIELLPNVITHVAKQPFSTDSRAAEDLQVLADSLQEIRSVLERAQRRVPNMIPVGQREMFKPEPKPRGRSR